MSTGTIAPPPFQTPIDSRGDTITQNWADWFVLAIMRRLQQAPVMASAPATLTGQHASLGLTSFNLPTVNEGIYRIGWTARVTTAGGVSSSLSVTVSYTRNGQGCTQTSQALTSNSIILPGSGFFQIHSDGAAPISYSTTYATVGVPAMVYELDVTCENIA